MKANNTINAKTKTKARPNTDNRYSSAPYHIHFSKNKNTRSMKINLEILF